MYRACSLLDRSCFVYASCYWNVIYAAFVTQSGQKRLTDKCIPVVYEVDGDVDQGNPYEIEKDLKNLE